MPDTRCFMVINNCGDMWAMGDYLKLLFDALLQNIVNRKDL